MKIGILQTGHAPEGLLSEGDYDRLFETLLGGHGFSFDNFPVVDNVFPANAQAADGWLITGSKHGAYEDHDWIPPLEQLIRNIHTAGKPLIGVCFGHQIIAQALGGTVVKYDGGWSVGPTEYQINGAPMVMNAWHQDQVTQRPADAQVIGSSDFCENAALIYGDTILTVQPHPEFASDFVGGLIKTRGRGVVPDDLLDAAAERLDQPLDSAVFAQQMAAFFKQERSNV